MRVLVLGASGMLGNCLIRYLGRYHSNIDTIGLIRRSSSGFRIAVPNTVPVYTGVDVLNIDALTDVLESVKADVIINCVGLIKQLDDSYDVLKALPINSMFPHRLTRLAKLSGTRVIHISTDCVFRGDKGGYTELDIPDAVDLYGKSKQLGELIDYDNAITLRTSIIGHEIESANALLGWFLNQENEVKGYTNAIFSGLTTFELSRVIVEFVLMNSDIHGLYHVSSEAISKYDLLKMISEVYGKKIKITKHSDVVIDRSLNSARFNLETGYVSPPWIRMIEEMKSDWPI